MKHLIKIEEHIMDNISSNSSGHIISKLSKVKPEDLIPKELYEHSFRITSGEYEGETFKTIQKFLKKSNEYYIFRVVKIYSPHIANKLNIENKDLIKVKEDGLENYHHLN